MHRAKRFVLPNVKGGRPTSGWEPIKAGRVSMANRSRSSRAISATTSIDSGIGCPPAVIPRHRCAGWTYRKAMDERDPWGSRRWRIALPRWRSNATSSRCWSACSIATPMGIDPGAWRIRHCPWHVSAVGVMTGCWTSISKASSMPSIVSY